MVSQPKEAAMIDAIREALLAKAEASRRYHSAPTPSFVTVVCWCVLVAIIIAAGAAL